MIRRIIKQIKSASVFGVVVVTLACGAAVAKTHTDKMSRQTTVKWRPNYNSSGAITGWTNVNGEQQGTDYECTGSSQVCTAQFPAGTTPTASTPVPTDHVNGVFN